METYCRAGQAIEDYGASLLLAGYLGLHTHTHTHSEYKRARAHIHTQNTNTREHARTHSEYKHARARTHSEYKHTHTHSEYKHARTHTHTHTHKLSEYKRARAHTHTHSECAILIAFPLQQWLHERASMLRLSSLESKLVVPLYLIRLYTDCSCLRATQINHIC